MWCKVEFATCYTESLKDPAFRLFVIMMEPLSNLENISPYMKSFFENNSYLSKNDPQLFTKIANYLAYVKEAKVTEQIHVCNCLYCDRIFKTNCLAINEREETIIGEKKRFIDGEDTSKMIQGSLRIRTYDAFVCYNDASGDYKYVLGTILPELEGKHDPPLKLCIHDRDFELGIGVLDNIENAIKNSSSAIIVMSQAFVNSKWCKLEFRECYVENENDDVFRLFVIMMQPARDLKNTSLCIEKFFVEKTYVSYKDPLLFKKIGDYLTKVNPKSRHNDDIKVDWIDDES